MDNTRKKQISYIIYIRHNWKTFQEKNLFENKDEKGSYCIIIFGLTTAANVFTAALLLEMEQGAGGKIIVVTPLQKLKRK